MNDYINITLKNIDNEHLCCAMSDKKHQQGVVAKKQWLKEQLPKGHVFRKLNVQGKVFIEYAPLEVAWAPVSGQHYMYIYCLWVAGSFKGQGYGKELLEYAIEDSRKQEKKGLCLITSKKKKPYLAEKKFFQKYGFEVVDAIGDYELLALSFEEPTPKFCDSARKMRIDDLTLTIYYSPQCPFTTNCIQELMQYQNETKTAIRLLPIDTLEKAKQAPCVFHNWATFQEGTFLSNTLLNKAMITKLLSQ